MTNPLRYLADEQNLMRFKQRFAVFVGFSMLLIATLMVAICAMDRRSPRQALYVTLSIAGCLWLAVTIFLAGRYSARAWPSVLIYVTTSLYIATAGTLAMPNLWLVSFYWACAAVTTVGGVIEIRRRDFADR